MFSSRNKNLNFERVLRLVSGIKGIFLRICQLCTLHLDMQRNIKEQWLYDVMTSKSLHNICHSYRNKISAEFMAISMPLCVVEALCVTNRNKKKNFLEVLSSNINNRGPKFVLVCQSAFLSFICVFQVIKRTFKVYPVRIMC